MFKDVPLIVHFISNVIWNAHHQLYCDKRLQTPESVLPSGVSGGSLVVSRLNRHGLDCFKKTWTHNLVFSRTDWNLLPQSSGRKPVCWFHRLRNLWPHLWKGLTYFHLIELNICIIFIFFLRITQLKFFPLLIIVDALLPPLLSFFSQSIQTDYLMTFGKMSWRFHKCSRRLPLTGRHHSERCLGRPLGIEENIGLSVTHLLHTANLHLRVITVDPETWGWKKNDLLKMQQDVIGWRKSGVFLTSFCIVAVCGVVPWAKAFTMMHNYSRQIVGVASSVNRVTWACAAVWFDVQNLVKGHMDADFLPMVPPWPSAMQQEVVSVTRIHYPDDKNKLYWAKALWCTDNDAGFLFIKLIQQRETSENQQTKTITWSVWGATVEPEVSGKSEAAYVPLTELWVCGMISVFVLTNNRTIWWWGYPQSKYIVDMRPYCNLAL